MDNSFKNLISPAKSILILLPTNPNFDQVASATALYLVLNQEGQPKEVTAYAPTPMIVEFNRLIAVNKVKEDLGNKNLCLAFENYNPQGIEKVSWDINDGQFQLTIVPKANIAPPNQDQVKISYSGVAADLIILIGGEKADDFPALKSEELGNAILAHIGTSEFKIDGKTIASLATPGSSISEVTANIIKGAGYKIEADIATNLLLGIEETSQGFNSPAVTADTFALVAELMRDGGKRLSEQKPAPQMPLDIPAVPGMPSNVPTSWTEPKIFKGTSVS